MGNKQPGGGTATATTGSVDSENLFERQRSKHSNLKKLQQELTAEDANATSNTNTSNTNTSDATAADDDSETTSVPLKPPQSTKQQSSSGAFDSFMDDITAGIETQKSMVDDTPTAADDSTPAAAGSGGGGGGGALDDSTPIPPQSKHQKKLYSRSGYDITSAVAITPAKQRIRGIGIDHVYKSLSIIAEGGSCSVLLVRATADNRQWALKQMALDHKYNPPMYAQEILALKSLASQPNVLRHFDHWIDSDSLYLITEYCSGGSLLDKILEMQQFSENDASAFVKTLLTAIAVMHDQHLIHRDLKPENIVFGTDPYGTPILKIIDFGDSITLEDEEFTTIYAGTRPYMAPQLFKTKAKKFFTHLSSHERKRYYGHELKKADIWSIGVICYVLVCGRLPFNGSRDQLPALICKGKFRWPRDIDISQSCKDFVNSLLVFDPSQRVSAKQALLHAWLGGKASKASLGATFRNTLREFHQTTKLTKLLVKTIWNVASGSERKLIKYGLKKITAESDGVLTTQQMFDYMMNFCHVNENEQFYVECTAKELESLMEIPENGVHIDKIDIGGLMSSFSIARDASIYGAQLPTYTQPKLLNILENESKNNSTTSDNSSASKKNVIEKIIEKHNVLSGGSGPQYNAKKVTEQMIGADGNFDASLAFDPALEMEAENDGGGGGGAASSSSSKKKTKKSSKSGKSGKTGKKSKKLKNRAGN